MLKSKDVNVQWDNNKIELFYNVLIGKSVNWSDETNWINCIYDKYKPKLKTKNNSNGSDALQSKTQKGGLHRKRLPGKSEFDFIDHITDFNSNIFLNALLDSYKGESYKVNEVKLNIFDIHLHGNVGEMLGHFWNLHEENFIKNMENCFFYKRILAYERDHYINVINNYINKTFNRNSLNKLKLVNHLQSDLFNIPYDALMNAQVIKQSLLTVLDVKTILIQLTNEKIEKCRQLIGQEYISNWLDKQMTSLIIIYKQILQTEVR